MHSLSTMHIQADRTQVLATLKTNREEHAQIVAEARVGYLKKAQEALNAAMDELRSGKLRALYFSLDVPKDYTKVYDVAITMLELHTEPTVELDADQVKHLIRDEWEWSDNFYATNSTYSGTAASKRKF